MTNHPTERRFAPVAPQPDFAAMERRLLAWWEEQDMMGRYVRRNRGSGRRYSFIDGPITANNPMGVHHGWGRTYKDLYQRFHTMLGEEQRYQNGFDCQGLWVEVEVEKELGLKVKRDIEVYGIAPFVERCKERVLKYAAVQTEQSIRLGYWMDWQNSYFTMSNENNYTIWGFLKTCHEHGWMYKGHDSMPWCARCGTGLTENEMADEYREVTHTSPFVALPLLDEPGASLLIWTTTPWTLAANVAAAVKPDLPYARVRHGDQVFYLAEALVSTLHGEHEVLDVRPGSALVGRPYRGPFDELPAQQEVAHRVIAWEEVSDREGTGIVHIAPGCGKEDFALSKSFELPVLAPIDEAGNYVDGYGFLTGQNAKEVTKAVLASLREKGVLYRTEEYRHRYPHCWRCGSELVFRVVDEWFISMEELRPQMIAVVNQIQWIPEFCRDRELDWLRNMGDWMISKKRYWGLALPIYDCPECGHFEVIGSEDELQVRAVAGWDEFEGHTPHRPYVDAVRIACATCGAVVSRVKDVGTPWLDAGIVPFSTLEYRHNQDYWRQWFPADFITESFPGQFRNWFYSLLVMSTVLTNAPPFRVCFGFATLRDEKGEEMHKSKGNSIPFEQAADQGGKGVLDHKDYGPMGADAMRWLYMGHNPASNLNFGFKSAEEVRRRFFLTLWNVYSFFVLYANLDRFDPLSAAPPVAERSTLDRWLLAEVHTAVESVTGALQRYDAAAATRDLETLVDLLSNWYVRRSRRRFWKAGADQDKAAAYHTLYETLTTVIRLLAPFVPFLAEELYQGLVCAVDPTAPASVHLTDWPVADSALIDRTLLEATRLTIRVVGLGRAARSAGKQKVRQPLAAALLRLRRPDEQALLSPFADQIAEELNVKRVEYLSDESGVASYALRPNLPALGPRLGSDLPKLVAALKALDAGEAVAQLRRGERLMLSVGDREVSLGMDDVQPRAAAQEGYAVAEEHGYLVALATTLTDELREEGLAREFVHRIQTMRKSAGFEVSDRITLAYEAGPRLTAMLARWGEFVASETLATTLRAGRAGVAGRLEYLEVEGEEVTVVLARV
ncbi:MAG TPA: isoleucine--tRNA ligase [Chloroflexota bacterium]|nr:isoleucine--tRNA ligase [Chloroflexota bacterium]